MVKRTWHMPGYANTIYSQSLITSNITGIFYTLRSPYTDRPVRCFDMQAVEPRCLIVSGLPPIFVMRNTSGARDCLERPAAHLRGLSSLH